MAAIEVREAVPADLPQITAVALATGQDEEWDGADPTAEVDHLSDKLERAGGVDEARR